MQSKIIVSLTFLSFLIRFVFPNELNRIINGHYAAPKQFPYQTFLGALFLSNLQKDIAWIPLCGGIIISRNRVLTAAHCLDSPDLYAVKIYFGAVNVSDVGEAGQQRLVVKRDHFIIHNEWNSNLFANDIAMIKLPMSLIFDDYIKAVQLPKPRLQYEFSEATISGWGHLNGNWDPSLKYHNAPILPDRDCERIFKSIITSAVPSSLICIATDEHSPCKGDSGGPLVIWHESNFVLLGIASFITNPVCQPGYPVFFNKVSSYLTWIRHHARSQN